MPYDLNPFYPKVSTAGAEWKYPFLLIEPVYFNFKLCWCFFFIFIQILTEHTLTKP